MKNESKYRDKAKSIRQKRIALVIIITAIILRNLINVISINFAL